MSLKRIIEVSTIVGIALFANPAKADVPIPVIQAWLAGSDTFQAHPSSQILVEKWESASGRAVLYQVRVQGFPQKYVVKETSCEEVEALLDLHRDYSEHLCIYRPFFTQHQLASIPFVNQILESFVLSEERCLGLFEIAKGISVTKYQEELERLTYQDHALAWDWSDHFYRALGNSIGAWHTLLFRGVPGPMGWFHQDLHGGNILFDPSFQRFTLIDTAQVDIAEKPKEFDYDLWQILFGTLDTVIKSYLSDLGLRSSEILGSKGFATEAEWRSYASSVLRNPPANLKENFHALRFYARAIISFGNGYLGQLPIPMQQDGLNLFVQNCNLLKTRAHKRFTKQLQSEKIGEIFLREFLMEFPELDYCSKGTLAPN